MSGLLIGQQNVHLPEAGGGTSMAHRVDLLRLALAVKEAAKLLPISRPRNAIAGFPEVGGLRLIGHPRKQARLLSAFDLPEEVAAELEIVALLVDGKAPVAVDQNAVVDTGDQGVERDVARSRLQPHIGHALEGHAAPRIGITAAARFLLGHQMSLIANG